MSATQRAERFGRISKGCRWLDIESAEVWQVERVYAKAVRLASIRTGVTLVIGEGQRLVTAKGWRPLRGTEFSRSFEIRQGSLPVKLSGGRLPSVKVLRAARLGVANA